MAPNSKVTNRKVAGKRHQFFEEGWVKEVFSASDYGVFVLVLADQHLGEALEYTKSAI